MDVVGVGRVRQGLSSMLLIPLFLILIVRNFEQVPVAVLFGMLVESVGSRLDPSASWASESLCSPPDSDGCPAGESHTRGHLVGSHECKGF